MQTPTEPPGRVIEHSPRTGHEVVASCALLSPPSPRQLTGDVIIPAEQTSSPRTKGVRSFVQGHTAGQFWSHGPHSGTFDCESRVLLTRTLRGKETHAHTRTHLFKMNFQAKIPESIL